MPLRKRKAAAEKKSEVGGGGHRIASSHHEGKRQDQIRRSDRPPQPKPESLSPHTTECSCMRYEGEVGTGSPAGRTDDRQKNRWLKQYSMYEIRRHVPINLSGFGLGCDVTIPTGIRDHSALEGYVLLSDPGSAICCLF